MQRLAGVSSIQKFIAQVAKKRAVTIESCTPRGDNEYRVVVQGGIEQALSFQKGLDDAGSFENIEVDYDRHHTPRPGR